MRTVRRAAEGTGGISIPSLTPANKHRAEALQRSRSPGDSPVMGPPRASFAAEAPGMDGSDSYRWRLADVYLSSSPSAPRDPL